MAKKISIGYYEDPGNAAQFKFIPESISADPDQTFDKMGHYLIMHHLLTPENGHQFDVYEYEDNGYYVMDIDQDVATALGAYAKTM